MPGYARLSCEDAKILMDTRSATIVDIRDEPSFSAGHIREAQHLDNAGLQTFMDDADQDLPVIVCCYHGNMSQSAGVFLAERGFAEVYSLDGGYSEWAQKYPADCQAGN